MRVSVRAAKDLLISATLHFGIWAALSSWSVEASADSSKVLFEEHSISRPVIIDLSLDELRHRLGEGEVLIDPRDIAALSNEQLPISGLWNPELSITSLAARLNDGVSSYLRGSYKVAEQQLEAALALAWRNPALVVSDSTSRQWLTQALASLALTRQRLRGRASGLEVMTEQVRSFPELPVTVSDFGARGEALYGEARSALEAGPRGSLIIDVSDPDARIYVNEYGRGKGGAFSADMFPGAYRVLVMVGQQSRLYRISVHAHEQTRLSIDWAADELFTSSPTWIGLQIPQGSRTPSVRRLAEIRRRLARRLAFKDVIFVGAGPSPGDQVGASAPSASGLAPQAPLSADQRTLWGVVYERGSGRELRRGQLLLSGDLSGAPGLPTSTDSSASASADLSGSSTSLRAGRSQVQRFADFLNSGAHASEFSTAPSPEQELPPPAPPPPTEPIPTPSIAWTKWAIGGAGLIAVGGGLALLASREACTGCAGAELNSLWAISLVSTGVLSLGVATFMGIDVPRGSFRRSAALGLLPLGRGGFATLGWRF